MRRNRMVLSVLLFFTALSVGTEAQQLTYPPQPGERDFIVDEAGLLSPEDAAQIKKICDKLLTEKAVPIIIVTIPSMAKYGAKGWDIMVYAQNLFNTWGIGYKKWNHGILLLISKGDRKARIELGKDWAHKKDAQCQKIMNTLIIPEFKAGNFSAGILAGVKGLDAMARELKLPRRPRPWWHYALVIGAVALAIFTVVSLIQSGASGWAWLLWGVVFAIIGVILYQMLRSSSRGGFGGGSFGGGFSGGGGASGSW
ncbi:MAG: TPM domain-containing protein [Planctomycetes bacterium]|nr:TPM domain-containing protein [Planctomycetota bacterium]